MSSVFLIPDVNHNIRSFCDNNSLIVLSGVNKQLKAALLNVPFFKDHFFSQHPLLKDYEGKVFTILGTQHSSNCWKVMCKLMDSNSPVKNWNLSFLKEAIPHISFDLQSKKEWAYSRIEEICGKHYQDPNSSIDLAWKKFQKCETERVAMEQASQQFMLSIESDLRPAKEELRLTYSCNEKEIERTICACIFHSDYFLSTTEQEFQGSVSQGKGMTIDKFRLYRKIAQICERCPVTKTDLNTKDDESRNLFGVYQMFESERTGYEAICQSTEADLSLLHSEDPSELLSLHANLIDIERESALELEEALMYRPHLEECTALIDKILDDPQERSPEALDRIRMMINALPYERKKTIWETLYFRCTDGQITEDAWAEKHFPDHLQILRFIVADRILSYEFAIDPKSTLKSPA